MLANMIKKIFTYGASMHVRDHTEEHRTATMLELLYDLTTVIAIATAAGGLHHALVQNHAFDGVLIFLMIFFALWWAWMNFTWFASAYDTDDPPYRIAVLIQISGALVFTAGIPRIFSQMDFTIGLIGFLIMRVSLVTLWLRAAWNTDDKKFAIRNAIGISVCQLGWFLLVMVIPKPFFLFGFALMVVFELAVPFLAEKATQSPKFHRHHIIERYGLLTIIVLGECLLASSNSIKALSEHFNFNLLTTIIGGLITSFSMWWLYFDESNHDVMNSSGGTFLWGYGHFLIFSSVAMIGAGLGVVSDQLTGHAKIGIEAGISTIAIPVVIYLLTIWLIHELPAKHSLERRLQIPIAAVLILLTPFLPYGVFWIGLVMTCLIIVRYIRPVLN